METSDDEQGQKPLLFSTQEPQRKQSGVVGLLKARKWIIVFALAGVLAVAVIIAFIVTKSSNSGCSSHTDSDDCFFTGEIRLPSVLKPLTYEVRLHPNLTTFKFQGSIRIVVEALDNTNRIVFHQKGLKFSKKDVFVSGISNGKTVTVREMRFDVENEQVIIKTRGNLHKNQQYAVNVSKFDGVLNKKLEGFYRSSYKTKNGEIR